MSRSKTVVEIGVFYHWLLWVALGDPECIGVRGSSIYWVVHLTDRHSSLERHVMCLLLNCPFSIIKLSTCLWSPWISRHITICTSTLPHFHCIFHQSKKSPLPLQRWAPSGSCLIRFTLSQFVVCVFQAMKKIGYISRLPIQLIKHKIIMVKEVDPAQVSYSHIRWFTQLKTSCYSWQSRYGHIVVIKRLDAACVFFFTLIR